MMRRVTAFARRGVTFRQFVAPTAAATEAKVDPNLFKVAPTDIDREELRGRQKDEPQYAHLSTKAVQSGESGGRVSMTDCITTPIAQTSAYSFRDTKQLIDFCENRYVSHEYGRYGNPTTKVCEDKILAMEKGEDCLMSTSGINTVSTTILALVKTGGLFMSTSHLFGRVREFVETVLPKMGIRSALVDHDQLEQQILSLKPALVFCPSPGFPLFRSIDITKLAATCKQAGSVLCIDNSYASPINQLPLTLGSDLVIHNASKYLAGHNDVLAGALVGKRELVQKVREMHAILGGVLDPHAAYLVIRGMKTLGARVEHQNRSAMQLAQYLSSMPQVHSVYYPGLPSHPDFALASRQMIGFGGSLTIVMKGGYETGSSPENTADDDIAFQRARIFVDSLRIPYIAASWGGVESLVEVPAISWGPETRQEMRKLGLSSGLVRFSVGIEDTVDLLADVAQALKKSSMWRV